jgi:uncharacterized protein (DUF1501 family)
MQAFLVDLKQRQLDDRVVVLAFGEFGRRIAENNSIGTDHATAGPVFLWGTKVQPGKWVTQPNSSISKTTT